MVVEEEGDADVVYVKCSFDFIVKDKKISHASKHDDDDLSSD